MKRRRVLVLSLGGIAMMACVVVLVQMRRNTMARQREAQYEAARRSYSEVLRMGVTRKEVESYLRGKGTPFQQLCCMPPVEGGRALDDLTKIGAEPHPWNCHEHNVYVGFTFVPLGPRLSDPTSSDTHTLTGIRIFHRLENCL